MQDPVLLMILNLVSVSVSTAENTCTVCFDSFILVKKF